MTAGKFMDLSLEGFTSVRILKVFVFFNDSNNIIINMIFQYNLIQIIIFVTYLIIFISEILGE